MYVPTSNYENVELGSRSQPEIREKEVSESNDYTPRTTYPKDIIVLYYTRYYLYDQVSCARFECIQQQSVPV